MSSCTQTKSAHRSQFVRSYQGLIEKRKKNFKATAYSLQFRSGSHVWMLQSQVCSVLVHKVLPASVRDMASEACTRHQVSSTIKPSKYHLCIKYAEISASNFLASVVEDLIKCIYTPVAITQECFQHLMESMPQSIVLRAKGSPSQYYHGATNKVANYY